MNSSLFIIIIFLLVITVGLIKRINCYDSFISGVNEGSRSVINMFSFILTFAIAINLLNSSHLLEFISEKINFKYIDILIQIFVRPFSSSSSLSIMLKIYEKYGVDSRIALLSTFVHTVSDTTFYMISFYFGCIEVKNVNMAILCGVIVNIIGVILSFGVVLLFF